MRVKRNGPVSPRPGRFLLSPPLSPLLHLLGAFLSPAAKSRLPFRQPHIVGNEHVLNELPRRIFPAIEERMLPCRLTIKLKGAQRRFPQVEAQYANARIGHDVFRSACRISSDRNAGGESL